jgi:hypothetical protein
MSGFLNSDEESNVVRNLLEEFQMVETQMVETQMVETQQMEETQMVETQMEDADATHAREITAIWQELRGNYDLRGNYEEEDEEEGEEEDEEEEEDADATHAREFAAFLWQQLPGNNEDEDEDEDEEEKKEKVCEVDCSVCTAKPLFAVPEGVNLDECPICYECIEMVNVTIARCGHTFHASCLFKALELKTDCPMCRTQLINILEDDDDDDTSIDDDSNNDTDTEDEDDDFEDEDDEDIEDDESEIRKVTHEQLATKLTHIGYTPADFLRIAGCRVKSENNGKYVCAFYKKFHEDVDKIILGEIKLADRDTRTYAQVLMEGR